MVMFVRRVQSREAKEVSIMDRDVRSGDFAEGAIDEFGGGRALSFAELAHVVHDFKSPLSVVTLETQVLQRQLDDGGHVEMVNATARMLLNLDYIDRLVQDLVDSCAIDAGH